MSFSKEEMAAAGRMIEAGMAGGVMAPGMDAKPEARERDTIPVSMGRMLASAEEIGIGPVKMSLRPLSMGEMQTQFWPMAWRLPFCEVAIQTDGPGVDYEWLAARASEVSGETISPGIIARQWSMLQQDTEVSWLLTEMIALMLVDNGFGPAWPRPDIGPEPGEDATDEERIQFDAALMQPAPGGRLWLDDAIKILSVSEWCDLLRILIEVNAGYRRTAESFATPAPEGKAAK